ncbi:sporulation protein YunB [Clostridium estertheticum]|uniref:Sporulation protein YunB n=3 Tax=Clostridium estertheticum TaxID=238834 RepID=A0A1J0GH90_9CLOT|nr:sporulation protein YunB [Clostridium estertheticum]APC40729.1 sporulation protein YunB [Clostridium estertheticum subsp. estertheticum]MBU3074297.1 sporulation protein YunB [Clostridium estertheticum]MBU3164391.1 sporulation protein YunB [Clostridium estertheticum]MBU3170958.1 sporulation protein YunB [Clostridium estertheticum]MBU3184398.1 sporulation protein YunB [Clostridium estertheticum]
MGVMNINNKIKGRILIIIAIVMINFTIFIYIFDRTTMPTVMAVADSEMRAKATEIVNKAIIDEYSNQFNYDEIIKVDKDSVGNIVMLKADTLKMNKIACDVALKSQKELMKLGDVGIKVPIGYITRNNILSYYGPSVNIKMQPIGHVETKYSSEFESAGINQTRHKIYVKVKTTVRVIIPLKSNDIEVTNEVPIAETIIVGKTPNTSVQLDLNGTGFKLGNSN